MEDQLKRIHDLAYFISALASASEKNIGRSSHSICSLAGKRFGCEATKSSAQSTDPLEAISILRDALAKEGIVWEFEPFQGERSSVVEETGSVKKVRLVFHTCMVRNALFRYSHDQRESLCYMAHGVFAGALQQVMPGWKAELEIIHAGPNACLKELVLEAQS